jgi:catechol 2,3-dioxygenase-like lactoylglutathione lyase family enzyme
MHIDHINIRAPQDLLEQVRQFYCSVFGLEEGFRPAFSSGGHWLYAGDRPLVHLSIGGEARAAGPPSHLDHVAFQSTGLGAFQETLDEHTVAYRSNYIPEIDLSQLFFSDPAGTGLEVNFPGERAS